MRNEARGHFSVVIPTLQRAAELHPLVEMCAAHPRVLEVLVINNATKPLHWSSPKVRVLQQAENIYVNPAWNLGAREARGEYLAILNDDILFEPALFDLVARALRLPAIGLIGTGERAVTGPAGSKLALRPVFKRTNGFGVAMFSRRNRYVPIPSEMRIFCGDDWLFHSQVHPNFVITDFAIRTEMSTTSGATVFAGVKGEDLKWMRENGLAHARYLPRFKYLAAVLRKAGLAT